MTELLTGLVLGGGGARGAYEAGVLLYLQTELARELPAPPRFEIVTGTSVGAINACHVAAGTSHPLEQALGMVDLWRGLSMTQVLHFRFGDLMRFAREAFGRMDPLAIERHGGLVDASALQALVMRGIRWRDIGRAIRSGHLRGLSVSATHVASGRTNVFIQMLHGALPLWTNDPHFVATSAHIGPQHALASAAIPLLFPAVKVDGRLYVDGGLRQNVPLSPALRMGADRVAVVSLRHEMPVSTEDLSKPPPADHPEAQNVASAPFLFGKTLNALMLDRTDADLDRLQRLNDTLRAGTDAFGPRYGEVMNHALSPRRNQPIRYVRNILVRPSEDIGMLAAEYSRSRDFQKRTTGLVGAAIRRLADREPTESADMLSYLLFEGSFTSQLIELGRRDARALRDEWLAFFSPEPHCEAERVQFEERKRQTARA